MGGVFIRCPRTGREVSTGLQVGKEEFAALRPTIRRMRCPACGSEHAWSRGSARWREIADGAPEASSEAVPLPSVLDDLVKPPREAERSRGHISRIAKLAARLLDHDT